MTSVDVVVFIRDVSVGDVVTLAMNDSQRQLDMGMFCVFSYIGTVAIIVVFFVLYHILGVAIVAGYAVMLVFLPVQRAVATTMGRV